MKTEAEIKDTLELVTRSKNRIRAVSYPWLMTNVAAVVDILDWVLDNPNNLNSLIDALRAFEAGTSARERASRQ